MPKQMTQQFDIVIVGAGLVGASLAAHLNKICPQLKLAVVDGGSAPQLRNDGFDPRVVALTHASKNLFESLGLWPKILESDDHYACPYQHMRVWDGEGTGEIEFHATDLHQENLGYIVENSHLLNQVLSVVENAKAIKIFWQDGLKDLNLETSNNTNARAQEHQKGAANNQQILLESGLTLTAPLVLAADGANSQVRKLAGFETREWHYGQQAIVTTVKTENSHQNTAWQRFMGSGPLAFLPLLGRGGDDQHCSIVWSLSDKVADDTMALDDEEFSRQLETSFESALGRIEHIDKRFCFPLRQRHAKRYVKPGIALVGDAAHTIHPLAGQGVNLGLLDVVAIGDEISRALNRQMPLDEESILRRYQRARSGPNLAMMGAMEGFKQLFGAHNPWLTVARNLGMGQLNRMPLLKNIVAKKAMGI